MSSSKTVLFYGWILRGLTRVKTIEKGLIDNGWKVKECVEWRVEGLWDAKKLRLAYDFLKIYFSLLFRFLRYKDYDVILIHHFGLPFVPFIKLCNLTKRKIIVLDSYILLTDTYMDRCKSNKIIRSFLSIIENICFSMVDFVLVDTMENLKTIKYQKKGIVIYNGAGT